MKNIKLLFLITLFTVCQSVEPSTGEEQVAYFETAKIIAEADSYLAQSPITVTTAVCERSVGTLILIIS